MDWFQQGDMESGMNLQGAWAKMAEGLIVFWIWKKGQCIEEKGNASPRMKAKPSVQAGEERGSNEDHWFQRAKQLRSERVVFQISWQREMWAGVENCTCGRAGEWIMAVFNPQEAREPRPKPTTPSNQHYNFPLLGRDSKRNRHRGGASENRCHAERERLRGEDASDHFRL